MTVRVGGETSRLRRAVSFAASAGVHSWVLAWVILGAAAPHAEHPRSIYDQEIRPYEKKIVWYSLREKLPEISPADAARDARPPRAREKAPQIVVAGKRDDAAAAPLIWTPVPEVSSPKPLPLPNVIAVAPPNVIAVAPPKVIAVAPPKVLRPFVPPPADVPSPRPAPVLPEAPRVAAWVAREAPPVTGAGAKPQPRAFTPPPEVRMRRQAALQLPEAPTVSTVVEPNALPWAGAGAKPQPRAFVPPQAARPRQSTSMSLGAAPEVASAALYKQVPGAGLSRLPRAFIPSPSRPAPSGATPAISAEAPSFAGTPSVTAQATLAMVGLHPAKTTEVPAPPGSRAGNFSAGPEVRPVGGAGGDAITLLNVPGLMVKGGPKDTQPTLMAPFNPTSKENLLAAARIARSLPPKAPEEANAPRVAEAPDPRLAGRVVYTVAIQMPNITSYSGSWLVWFAEHEPIPGAVPPQMRPPIPQRKVDPKYIAAAAAERVEGKIRLFGVIRKDGHVDGIALLLHLDDRLDASAREALGKWQFEPALRNGSPVDVDAVFEIPFHLAPRPK